MRTLILRTTSFFAVVAYASLGAACPSCPVGREAREQVFNQQFGTNLLIAAAPFVVVGLVSLWAERVGKGH